MQIIKHPEKKKTLTYNSKPNWERDLNLTLKILTSPKPPSPSLWVMWKSLVAATKVSKGNSFCSCWAIFSKSFSLLPSNQTQKKIMVNNNHKTINKRYENPKTEFFFVSENPKPKILKNFNLEINPRIEWLTWEIWCLQRPSTPPSKPDLKSLFKYLPSLSRISLLLFGY